LDALASELKSKGGQILGEEKKEEEDSGDDSESEASEYEMPAAPRKRANEDSNTTSKGPKGGFEVVPLEGNIHDWI